MKDIVIIDGARTAYGTYGGALRDTSATELGVIAAKGALEKSKVRWSDLSTYQGRKLLPKTKEHDLSHNDALFTTCFQSCHSFQKRMATEIWDENGWRARVTYMRDVMMEGRRFTDEMTEDLVSYFTFAFGYGTSIHQRLLFLLL